MKRRILRAAVSALLAALLFVVPVLASTQVSPSVVTEVCTTCPVELSWVVGTTPGTMPSSGFTMGALSTSWELGEPEYIWLAINCTVGSGLSGLFIVFETGMDMLGVNRTAPPQGWPSVVPWVEDFESGAYIYGPEDGFPLNFGVVYTEFEVTPLVLGCCDLKVYLIQGAPEQEI